MVLCKYFPTNQLEARCGPQGPELEVEPQRGGKGPLMEQRMLPLGQAPLPTLHPALGVPSLCLNTCVTDLSLFLGEAVSHFNVRACFRS